MTTFKDLVLTDSTWINLIKRIEYCLNNRPDLNNEQFKFNTKKDLENLIFDYGLDSVKQSIQTISNKSIYNHIFFEFSNI